MLSDPENTSIISWLPNGQAFAVHDQDLFTSKILQKYFRRVIFRSFVRKLNRWGFRSVKRSISGFESTFEHKHFIRDQPELVQKMYCTSNPTSCTPRANKGVSKNAGASIVVSQGPMSYGMIEHPSLEAPLIGSHSSIYMGHNAANINLNEVGPTSYGIESIYIRELERRQMYRRALMRLIKEMTVADAVDLEAQNAVEE